MEREQAGTDGVERVDADRGKALLLEDCVEICDEGVRGLPVLVCFNGDFPRDDRRYEQFIRRISHTGIAGFAQQVWRIEPPKHGMSIEQKLHGSKSSGLPSSIIMSKPYSRSSSSVSRGFHQ